MVLRIVNYTTFLQNLSFKQMNNFFAPQDLLLYSFLFNMFIKC